MGSVLAAREPAGQGGLYPPLSGEFTAEPVGRAHPAWRAKRLRENASECEANRARGASQRFGAMTFEQRVASSAFTRCACELLQSSIGLQARELCLPYGSPPDETLACATGSVATVRFEREWPAQWRRRRF